MRSLAAMLLVFAACAVPRPAGERRCRAIVDAARLTGNSALDEHTLRARAAASECSNLDEAATALGAMYFDDGYVESQLSSRDGLITIVEGSRYLAGDIEVHETPAPSDALGDPAKLDALVRIHKGEIFSRTKIQASIAAIRAYYDESGFGGANVTPLTTLDREARVVKLCLEVARGPVYKIVAVSILGATGELAERTLALATLKAGEVFHESARATTRQRLEESRLFDSVTTHVESANPQRTSELTVSIEVKPRE